MRLKNTYGCTAVIDDKKFKRSPKLKEFAGSSLDRKKEPRKLKPKQTPIEEPPQEDWPDWVLESSGATSKTETNETEQIQQTQESKADAKPLRKMSPRTKSKIRKKVVAFSQQYKRLTFVTLTFVNKITDELAVNILRKFLDNMKKRKQDFQYIWVAERQKKNPVFPDNIHFHLITNKFWDIKKTWNYWLDLQAKHKIKPREGDFKPSSAFDVKKIDSKNIKMIGSYLTKYISKNADEFNCQVWNCSKKVSALYTDFYTGYEFLESVQRVPNIQIKELPLEHCNLHFIPLDRTTIRFYDRLSIKNLTVFKQIDQQQKEIPNATKK